MPSDSATGTTKSMPRRDSALTHELVMMCGGYEYFGSDLRSVFLNSSEPSWIIAYSLGAERRRMPFGSRFVRNDVFTIAPFS